MRARGGAGARHFFCRVPLDLLVLSRPGACRPGAYRPTASAVAGYPHITVPAGEVFGLPVGLSFFAGAHAEPALIRFAYAFEQETKARRKPGFLAAARV